MFTLRQRSAAGPLVEFLAQLGTIRFAKYVYDYYFYKRSNMP